MGRMPVYRPSTNSLEKGKTGSEQELAEVRYGDHALWCPPFFLWSQTVARLVSQFGSSWRNKIQQAWFASWRRCSLSVAYHRSSFGCSYTFVWTCLCPCSKYCGNVCILKHYHHHHHVVSLARISLTLSRHFSLSFIASGRSSGQHSVSSHSCWIYVRAGRPAFAQPYVGVHRSTSLMSSSLLLQQCPACLVRLTWIVFVVGGRWPYSWCLVRCCRQDLFNIACSILV